MQDRFIQYINDQHLFGLKDRLLLAVSGGVDSVVLCDLCFRCGFAFSIAHCNFKLRGDDSEADESFVSSLGGIYNVDVHTKDFDIASIAAQEKISIQVAARNRRYQWFHELIPGVASWIVTGHHMGDNIETMVMNFFRGTGISGLRGMLPRQGKVVRPLLAFTREDILAYALEHNLQWREDASNASDKYSRNYIRNQLLPAVTGLYPQAQQSLADNLRRFRETEILYHQAVGSHRKKLLENIGGEIRISIRKLSEVDPLSTVLFELLRPFGFTSGQIPQLLRLMSGGQGSYVSSPTHRLIRNRAWLILAPLDTAYASTVLVEKDDVLTRFEGGTLSQAAAPAGLVRIKGTPHFAFMDADKIAFPLLLRKWKAGDYFYPFGMKKKKKVSRFLIDQKCSPTQKASVWVLESGKRICWVVGHRLDDRFRVTEATKQVISITYDPHQPAQP